MASGLVFFYMCSRCVMGGAAILGALPAALELGRGRARTLRPVVLSLLLLCHLFLTMTPGAIPLEHPGGRLTGV